MVEANSAGPALPLTNFVLNTGSANSALATIEAAATAMHSALTIHRPRLEWGLAPKKSPRLRVERAARVGGNGRACAKAAELPRAAGHSAASCRRRNSSERRMESSCPTKAEAVFMSDSLVLAAPPRGCGLRAEIAEYSRFGRSEGGDDGPGGRPGARLFVL
jgi:hypothetical protein